MPFYHSLEEPLVLGTFQYKDTNPCSFELPADVPRSATAVEIAAFFRSGNENNTQVHTKLWTVNPDGSKHFCHHYGYRYPQNAINSDCAQFRFPVWAGCRDIKVQSPNVQIENCHNMQLFVTGWLIQEVMPAVGPTASWDVTALGVPVTPAASLPPAFSVFSSGWVVGPAASGHSTVVQHPFTRESIVSCSVFVSPDGGESMYNLSAVPSSGTGQYGWDVEIRDKKLVVTCRHNDGPPHICSLGRVATSFLVKLVGTE
jgi:hypothetical protein